ncbi:hypothetical protein Poli38472_001274 [Pythium oligandrum]|uniref:Uncharacterized protein n=1 Tax=Pythium oligandrum TaxID=41045 RepID=A0A8K1FT14_PYTOL|nr:hypothetical protein Poli38472_001274 [Pythium oligandrum]|eukprot:TMW69118.1 hypothetical protein Poli38472_001274 [Pythium oligandrum]
MIHDDLEVLSGKWTASPQKQSSARVAMEVDDAERIAQIKQVTPAHAVLSVEEAWRIATMWEMERPEPQTSWTTYRPRGRIQVEKCKMSRISIVESYEWIKLECGESILDSEVAEETRFRQLCGQLRGLCVTWALLSRCRGFSAEENPVFWKHVLDREPEVREVSDAVRFFQKNTFPTFKLWGRGWMHTDTGIDEAEGVIARTIVGVEPIRDEAVALTLDEIVARLLPLVDSTRMSEPVAVVLDHFAYPLSKQLPNSIQPATSVVQFSLSKIGIEEYEADRWSVNAKHPTLISIPSEPISLVKFTANIPDRVRLNRLLQLVFSYERSNPQEHADAIKMTRNTASTYGVKYPLSDQMIAAVCSGLPYARSVSSFQYEDSRTERADAKHDWAWIGYALFHPDTPDSTWREFALHDIDANEDLPSILSMMSKGNNLLSILNGTPAESTAYFSATLEPESLVFGNPRGIKSPRWKAKDFGPSFDVFASSCDMSALDEWVTLVAPALGLVYTRRENVLTITSRPPSVPQLTAFDVQSKSPCGQTLTVLPALLESIGTSLEHLVIKSFPGLDSFTFRHLLRRYPSLVSLGITDNGQLWREESVEDDESSLPKLRELTLWLGGDQTFVPFSKAAMMSSLCKLQALSVYIWSPGKFSQSDLQDVVTSLRYLRFFNCVGGLNWYHDYSYTISREETFRHLGFSPSDPISYACKEEDADSRYALASIVSSKVSTTSAANQLNRDLLGHVMAFVSERYPREFCVIDWNED